MKTLNISAQNAVVFAALKKRIQNMELNQTQNSWIFRMTGTVRGAGG